jgi:menaquinone-dependent protoporphyrinogen oxidase
MLSREDPLRNAILVGYATRTGSTAEVAQAVGAALREKGGEVDVKPLRDVKSLDGYRSVVIGAPLYMFAWHSHAKGFLTRHKTALEGRPVAAFALGPFHDEEKEWTTIRAQLDKELAAFPWLRTVAHEVFGGVFDPAKLRFPMSLIPALKKMPPSDIRDWDAIRAWVGELAGKL